MSKAKIRIPTPLRSFTGGSDEVEIEGADVRAALADLGEKHGNLLPRIMDAGGGLRPFVNLYVSGKNIRALNGLDTEVKDGDVLSIVPAVAGGRS
jgi:molybdopterin synthase sulfur carrier subunit